MVTKIFDITENEIMKKWVGSPEIPLLSICCTTYNHEEYIADAINGFLMQETDFAFEILIRDDCSTDKTAEIVRRYYNKYPNLIKPIFEKENQFSQGVRPMPVLYKKARGKYIALCEGDDYWTNSLKLQKQVELLEKYKQSVMSVGYTDVYDHNNGKLKYLNTYKANGKELQMFEDIKQNYFHTSTYVIKANFLNKVLKDIDKHKLAPTDPVLRHMLIEYGPFVLLSEVVSVYRITDTGVWAGLSDKEKFERAIALYKKLYILFTGEQKQYQVSILYRTHRTEFIRLLRRRKLLRALYILPTLIYWGSYYGINSCIEIINDK